MQPQMRPRRTNRFQPSHASPEIRDESAADSLSSVSSNHLQKRVPSALKEKGQYLLAFTVVGSMLLVAGFPVFVIFFFGIFAYFLLRMFSAGSRSETREIFEFYLTANEILRDDDRRWYGFEIQEAIRRGNEIVGRMGGAPPLVHFALGALQNKAGDHKAATSNLAYVVENVNSDEVVFTDPSPELRSYVKVLRKIEREPADAPLTSSAVRALERARRLRGKTLLEDSRTKFAGLAPVESERPLLASEPVGAVNDSGEDDKGNRRLEPQPVSLMSDRNTVPAEARDKHRRSVKEKADPFVDRKPITEVLHDIYDKNIQ
jgi:hypothetical protein